MQGHPLRQIGEAKVQQEAGIVTTAKSRVVMAVDRASTTVSEKVAKPMAKRVASTRSRVAKARSMLFEYFFHVTGAVQGMLAWTYEEVKTKGIRTWALETAHTAGNKAHAAAGVVKVKATHFAVNARAVAGDKAFQTTAASAAGGAVTLGTTGGLAGLATGTMAGAAIGLVPALFTFGLSIPVGAAIGGSCGLVTGAAAGSAVGAVGGGAAGYGAYAKRDQIAGVVDSSRKKISGAASKTMTSVNDCADFAKEKAVASAEYARNRATAVRARLTQN